MFKWISKYSSSKYLDSEPTGPRAKLPVHTGWFQQSPQDQQIYNNLKYHPLGAKKIIPQVLLQEVS